MTPDDHESAVRVRRATADDADLLLDWANDPPTRAASLATAPIPRATHLAWLDRVLADPATALWIGLDGDRPIGQVRVAVDAAGDGEVSISLDPAARGRGLSVPLLEAGLEASAEVLPVREFVAHVRPGNEPSRRLFLRAGFRAAGTVERFDVAVLEFRRAVGGRAP